MRIGLLIVALTGCVSVVPRPGAARMGPMQAATAVVVELDCAVDGPGADLFTMPDTVCGRGSGTIVDSRHVLTAYHVVRTLGALARVHVVTKDLRRLRMVVAREWMADDVAVLELASADSFGPVPPPIYTAVVVGEAICVATAEPAREFHCGLVEPIDGYGQTPLPKIPETHYGDVPVAARIIPGNSGAAVYDSRGRLVGIAVEGDAKEHGRIRAVDPAVIP